MQIDLGTCYQGMSTCVTFFTFYLTINLPLRITTTSAFGTFVLKYFVQYCIIEFDPSVR